MASNNFGSGNNVQAGPGPVAIAGSILQTGATVFKFGPGFNINGVKAGGAAAVDDSAQPAPGAASARSIETSTAASAPTAASKKAAAHSAAKRAGSGRKNSR